MNDWLPPHKCGLYLTHNEHKDVYEIIEAFYDLRDFVSVEEWDKALKEDSVWVLQWYPATPVGLHRIAASSLEAIQQAFGFHRIAASSLEAIQQALKEDKYE